MNKPEAFSTWFKGAESDWGKLSLEERDELSFRATGCEIAYPTWPAPVDCVHTSCQIRRGELPKIALTNSILRGEASSGWLRFIDRESRAGRAKLAGIFRAYRARARETGIYDPWKLNWEGMVGAAFSE